MSRITYGGTVERGGIKQKIASRPTGYVSISFAPSTCSARGASLCCRVVASAAAAGVTSGALLVSVVKGFPH